MSDETVATPDTTEEAAPEVEETEVAPEGEAPAEAAAPTETAAHRVALKRARKEARAAARDAETAKLALAEARALSESAREAIEWYKKSREGTDLQRARALGIDVSRLAGEVLEEDTPEATMRRIVREEREAYDRAQAAAQAQRTGAQRERAESAFVAQARRLPDLAAVLRATDEDGEPVISEAELVSAAYRVGNALMRKKIESGERGDVSDSEVLEALARRFRPRSTEAAGEPKKGAIKPLTADASALRRGELEAPTDAAGVRDALRRAARARAHTNLGDSHHGRRQRFDRKHHE